MIQGTINHSQAGVIGGLSVLNPKGSRGKKDIYADLLLTALIDAFSILVIFLLMSFSSSGDILYISKGMELPKAGMAQELERQPVVRIEPDKLYVEDKVVTREGLVEALIAIREQYQKLGQTFPGIVTIQADRRVKYQDLSPIVQAANQAGFSDIQFAVIGR